LHLRKISSNMATYLTPHPDCLNTVLIRKVQAPMQQFHMHSLVK
jgi:hypothetical protein